MYKHQTHNYLTRNAEDYSINKTKKVFSDCAIRNCGPFLEFLGQNCETLQNHQTLSKSVNLNTIDFILSMSCVFLCILLLLLLSLLYVKWFIFLFFFIFL